METHSSMLRPSMEAVPQMPCEGTVSLYSWPAFSPTTLSLTRTEPVALLSCRPYSRNARKSGTGSQATTLAAQDHEQNKGICRDKEEEIWFRAQGLGSRDRKLS